MSELSSAMNTPRRTTDIFAFFFDSRVPALFVIGALIMAVMGNAAYDFAIDLIGQKTRGWLIVIVLAGLFVIVVFVLLIKARAEILNRRISPRIGGSKAFSTRRKAIIFTVGKQSDSIDLCIRHQKPELVGLIRTPGSEQYADSLIISSGLGPENVLKKAVDPWNVSEVCDGARTVLAWILGKGVSPGEVVFDTTGGLTTMSVATFLVADDNKIDSQYVKSEYDGNGKRLPKTEEAVFIKRLMARMRHSELKGAVRETTLLT